MRRAIRFGLAGVLLVAGGAVAYEWQGAKWARSEMPVPYVVNATLSADLPDREALEGVQTGFNAWNALPCSFMRWEYKGRTENRAWGADDGENVVSWREDNWDDSPSALAICSSIWNFQGNLSDTDVKFNGFHHQWAHFRNGGGGGGTDIASVQAHESGHALGLGHSNVPGSTMWPSTGPGDISGRSLGADDIQGACEVYPSGGDVPDPDEDPPPPEGTVDYGGDCSRDNCKEGLFCVSDGRESYCTRVCTPPENTCGNGWYCAQLSGGGGACAKGEDPRGALAGFGEACGADKACEAGLICVNDDESLYCTGPCADGACPGGYFCIDLQGGGNACARGEGMGGPGDLPGAGEPCTDRGLCQNGLFCINDASNVNDQGDVVPYCTKSCDDGACDDGFRCVEVQPSGTACQKIPSAGNRKLGDQCWVNPEFPWEQPSCGAGLICVDFVQRNQEVVEPGTCSKNCTKDDCCPEGWGCAELTPVFAQCRQGETDSPSFACAGTRPPIDDPLDPVGGSGGSGGAGGAGGGVGVDEGGDGGGCAAAGHALSPIWPAMALLLPILARRRRPRP